jgi:hypothetical protein
MSSFDNFFSARTSLGRIDLREYGSYRTTARKSKMPYVVGVAVLSMVAIAVNHYDTMSSQAAAFAQAKMRRYGPGSVAGAMKAPVCKLHDIDGKGSLDTVYLRKQGDDWLPYVILNQNACR